MLTPTDRTTLILASVRARANAKRAKDALAGVIEPEPREPSLSRDEQMRSLAEWQASRV